MLAKYGYTERMAHDLCVSFGLLSPIYQFATRNGCWFCPNASCAEYMRVKRRHPDLWGQLRKLAQSDNVATPYFKYNKTFTDIDNDIDSMIRQTYMWEDCNDDRR